MECVIFLHGYELKDAVNFIQPMYVMQSAINRNVLGFYWKALSLQMNVRQWEFVRLIVLSNSGDVSCSALFEPHSYILYLYILSASVLLCPLSILLISSKLIY